MKASLSMLSECSCFNATMLQCYEMCFQVSFVIFK